MHKEMQMLLPPEVMNAIVRYIDMKYAELYGNQPAVKRIDSYAIVNPIAAHNTRTTGQYHIG